MDQTFTHPGYSETDRQHNNDIGLVRMARSVRFSQYVRPACLSHTFDAATADAVYSAWNGSSVVRTEIPVELQSHGECLEQYDITEDTQFCARLTHSSACEVSKRFRYYSIAQETAIFMNMCISAGIEIRIRATSNKASFHRMRVLDYWHQLVSHM